MEIKSERFQTKRKLRGDDEEKWDCSVCTYMNKKESYKCEICHTRKGTSTRRPRLNTQVVEQQQLIAQSIIKEKDDDYKKKKDLKISKSSSLKSAPLCFEIFANGYSVMITEFPTKTLKSQSINYSETSGFGSNHVNIPDDVSSTDSFPNTNASQFSNVHSNFTEYDFTDNIDMKMCKSNNIPTYGLSRSNDDRINNFCSYSSASSSVGGNTYSRTSSPPNFSGVVNLTEVKREQADLVAEQSAHDGDDECDEDDDESTKLGKLPLKLLPNDSSLKTKYFVRNKNGDLLGSNGISPSNEYAFGSNELVKASDSSNKHLTRTNKSSFQNTRKSRKKVQSQLNVCSLRSSGYKDKNVSKLSDEKPIKRRNSNRSYKTDLNSRPRKRERLDLDFPFDDTSKNDFSNSSKTSSVCKSYMSPTCNHDYPIVDSVHLNKQQNSDSHSFVPLDSPKNSSSPILKPLSTNTLSNTVVQSNNRLSTESKNTSAMTDSSGANALEMST